MLLLNLKNAACPCPRCLVQKTNAHRLGMASDMAVRKQKRPKVNSAVVHNVNAARMQIFGAVTSAYVQVSLESKSLTPRLVRTYMYVVAQILIVYCIRAHSVNA